MGLLLHIQGCECAGFRFNALALAKVMLVAQELHLGDQFRDAPLIYPTLLKSFVFTIVLACFKIVEDGAMGICSVPEIHKPSLNQPLNDSENHRGRDSEHEHSISCFQRSQQSPRWRHNQITVTQGRVVDR